MQKTVLAIAGAAVALAAAAAGALYVAGPEPARSPALLETGDTEFGGPFELTAHTGERVSSEALIDGPTLFYFGYTYCPDVCPIDTQVMADAVGLLAETGVEVTPVFVTVDPARDDPETLATFAGYLHPEMVGLTGSEAEIRAAAEAFRVYYEKVEMEDSAAGYLMNHTAFMYLAVPGEGVVGVIRNGHPPQEVAEAIRQALAGRG